MKGKRKARLRENVEAVAFAIVLALVLKYFVLEAYQIPTSSMQPTLMGSAATRIHDRILVDKLSYTFREPRRFDVVVFRYPLNTIQNYVKRLWGLPGETLAIVSGNVYRRVEPDGDGEAGEGAFRLEALRKPDHVQEGLWRLVYDVERTEIGGMPVRPEADFFTRSLTGTFAAGRDRKLRLDLASPGTGEATFRSNAGFGDRLRNHYWHGYPARFEDTIRRVEGHGLPDSGALPVQDLRLTVEVEAGAGIQRVFAALEIAQAEGGRRAFRAEVAPDGGRLLAALGRGPPEEVAAFPRGYRPGRRFCFSFAHVDDQVVVRLDGRVVARHPYVPAFLELAAEDPLRLSFGAEGEGTAVFSRIRIERDEHFLDRGIAQGGRSFTVPEGHYFMLGDNTMASEDGRLWTELSFKLAEDGRVLPPASPEPGRVLRGNRRPVPLAAPLDADENPVVVRRARKVVFTDAVGQKHVFPWDGQEWNPHPPSGVQAHPAPFVPTEFVVGRALLVFWPLNPLGAFRLGFVR